MKVFYYGCSGDVGHYLWASNKSMTPLAWPRSTTPTPWTIRELDAPSNAPILQPAETRAQGVWRLSHRSGWTAIGCHDYTADSRPGSVSVFVAEGEHDQAAMERIAAEQFPAVWARITRAR